MKRLNEFVGQMHQTPRSRSKTPTKKGNNRLPYHVGQLHNSCDSLQAPLLRRSVDTQDDDFYSVDFEHDMEEEEEERYGRELEQKQAEAAASAEGDVERNHEEDKDFKELNLKLREDIVSMGLANEQAALDIEDINRKQAEHGASARVEANKAKEQGRVDGGDGDRDTKKDEARQAAMPPQTWAIALWVFRVSTC